MPLASSAYGSLRTLADDRDALNLAWTVDERQLLTADLDALVAAELAAEARDGLPYVHSYFVKDPYGDAELAPSVAAHFGLTAGSWSVTCAAGVNALLHAIAVMVAGGRVCVTGDGYPDLPHWVAVFGGSCVSRFAVGADDDVAAVDKAGASVVLVERPRLRDDKWSALSDVESLCRAVASYGALVVIDESYANYYPPQYSAVPLVQRLDNLVVLRGLSKAYWLGGARFGYCVASAPATERVRSALAPMLASSVSIRLAKSVLALGDITGRLRERTVAAKAETLELLAAAGLPAARPASSYLPYVLSDDERFGRELERRGVLVKQHLFHSARDLRPAYVTRLSVPLAAARMERLRTCLASPRG